MIFYCDAYGSNIRVVILNGEVLGTRLVSYRFPVSRNRVNGFYCGAYGSLKLHSSEKKKEKLSIELSKRPLNEPGVSQCISFQNNPFAAF